jgi:hypothetical protein
MGISWLFMVHIQLITICFTPIDSCNTSTWRTERTKISALFEAFIENFHTMKRFSNFNWHYLFLIRQTHYWFLLLQCQPQPHGMSPVSFWPYILPLHNWTNSSISTSPLWFNVPILQPKSLFWVPWGLLMPASIQNTTSKYICCRIMWGWWGGVGE